MDSWLQSTPLTAVKRSFPVRITGGLPDLRMHRTLVLKLREALTETESMSLERALPPP